MAHHLQNTSPLENFTPSQKVESCLAGVFSTEVMQLMDLPNLDKLHNGVDKVMTGAINRYFAVGVAANDDNCNKPFVDESYWNKAA